MMNHIKYFKRLLENVSLFQNDKAPDLMVEETSDYIVTNADKKEFFWKQQKIPIMIGVLFLIVVLHVLGSAQKLIVGIINIDTSSFQLEVGYSLFWLVFPFVVWVLSSLHIFWNYYNRKIFTLSVCFTCVVEMILFLVSSLYCRYFIPVIFWLIRVNDEISPADVVNFIRVVLGIINILIGFVLYEIFFSYISKESIYKLIIKFRLSKYLDLRVKKYDYTFSVVRRMDNGAKYVVNEKDRFLHILADGTTGTGKTSSLILPAIADDLDQKLKNTDAQKEAIVKLINEKRVRPIKLFKDSEFNINYFEPITDLEDHRKNKQNKKKYEDVKYKMQSAGIVVFAPNAELADAVYEMASNRGFKNINRIDPELLEGDKVKPGTIGFNPFYLSPNLTGKRWLVEVENTANVFADILKALYEMNGKGDPYFTELNKTITKNTAKLLILTHSNLKSGETPNPTHAQILIGNFAEYIPYLVQLCRQYGDNGKPLTPTEARYVSDRITAILTAGMGGARLTMSNGRTINCGYWQTLFNFVWSDILGPKGAELFDRAQGLRNQMDSFLSHALIRDVLTADKSLDFDRALEDGDITIINYAYTLGNDVSMAFGLFLLLSFANAVFRRPGDTNTRIGCFTYIDELPILLHPRLEQFFSLGRQFRNAMFVALQTLDQMDKNEATKYLKGVLLGNCAHQIVFGRVSPSEMKKYSEMAGKVYRTMQQRTVSETALSSENPAYSYSVRDTPTLCNVLEGSDVRYRDFLEVTFFSVQDGTPIDPFVGRVNFLEPYRKKGGTHYTVNWEDIYYREYDYVKEIEEDNGILHQPSISNVFYDLGDRKNERLEGFNAYGEPVYITENGPAEPDQEKELNGMEVNIEGNQSDYYEKTEEREEDEESNWSNVDELFEEPEEDDFAIVEKSIESLKRKNKEKKRGDSNGWW